MLRRTDARWNADVIYGRLDYVTYSYFARKALLVMSQSRSRTEYLLPVYNIMVLE